MRVLAIRGRNLASLEGAFGFGGYLRYIRAYRGGKIHVAGCHVPRPFLPYAANGAGEGE